MKIAKVCVWVLCFFAVFFTTVFSQNTSGISYQGLMIRADNSVLSKRSITVKFSVYDDSEHLYYREYQETKTNSVGFFQLTMGQGKILKGSWEDIPWLSLKVNVKVEVDTLKNGQYFVYQEGPFQSVPYSRYAWRSNGSFLKFDTLGNAFFPVDSAFYVLSGSSPFDTILTLFSDGRIGIGTTKPRDGVEMGVNKRLHLSSEEWHLEQSGVITLQALNDSAKPALTWFDELGEIRSAITTYDRKRIDPKHNQEFVIETDNGKGEMLPRFAIPYGRDWTEIRTHNADFRVGDGGSFFVGSDTEPGSAQIFGNLYVGRRMGIGRKNWQVADPFYSKFSVVEIYSRSQKAGLLIQNEDGQHQAGLHLTKGSNTWTISNKGDLFFEYNDTARITVMSDGKMGIGNTNPQQALEVNGNVFSSGSLMSALSAYACYLETEEVLHKGDVAGVNPLTSKVRKYKRGDNLVGIVCGQAGVVANYSVDKVKNDSWALVALTGEVFFDKSQVKVVGSSVYTLDNILIGYKLRDGVLILR
ncbi:MAG: hypothetical protein RSA02_01635 [Bacteroidales bacterium]